MPLSKLGPELGMSGRGLAKLCSREGVPVPNRGWWAKKEFGWNPTPTKLPPRKPDESESIEFTIDRAHASLEAGDDTMALEPVPVRDTLDEPHPLVAATRSASSKTKQSENRTILLHGPGGLTVNVSRSALDRTLRILDGFVRALESKGCTVRPAEGTEKESAIVREANAIPFGISEEITRTELPLTPRQLREKERNRWLHSAPRVRFEPTGRLTLHLDYGYYGGHRRVWRDGARQRLEMLLPQAVGSILHWFDARKLEREERERRRLKQEREAREQHAKAQAQFQEDRRTRIVRDRLALWRELRDLSVWLEEVRHHASPDTEPALQQEWIGWIEEHLGRCRREALALPTFTAREKAGGAFDG
jgi:hypothetical protein